jgi:hypothetical protein
MVVGHIPFFVSLYVYVYHNCSAGFNHLCVALVGRYRNFGCVC